MPFLMRHCVAFLMSSAAGRPIAAMKIAEDHELADIYKEASRFLLDNFSHFDTKDLAILSEGTLLKLEKRRSWFLERLYVLPLIQIKTRIF